MSFRVIDGGMVSWLDSQVIYHAVASAMSGTNKNYTNALPSSGRTTRFSRLGWLQQMWQRLSCWQPKSGRHKGAGQGQARPYISYPRWNRDAVDCIPYAQAERLQKE